MAMSSANAENIYTHNGRGPAITNGSFAFFSRCPPLPVLCAFPEGGAE